MDNHPMNKEKCAKYYVWEVFIIRKDADRYKNNVSWVMDKYWDVISKVDINRDTIVFHFKFRRDSNF